jgi:phosphoglycerol transferase MdoB-like AlkP superfamily enzyme
MKKILLTIGKLILFWLLLFALQHVIFLIYNSAELKPASAAEVLKSFYYAISMDVAATSFLIGIPVVILMFSLFIKGNRAYSFLFHGVNYLLIFSCILISIIDTGLYSAWGSKINSKAISYLAFPGEMVHAAKAVNYWLFIMIFLAECAVVFYVYYRIFKIDTNGHKPLVFKILFIPVMVFLLILGMRGGFQTYPINKSWVYFSKYPVLNNSAINGFWNFMEIFVSPDEKENPYHYFTKEEAQKKVADLMFTPKDTTECIFNVAHPNIVLIMMEGVSAECMATLGGEPGIMPHLDSLTKQSLLFTDYYASGFRTEQGLISLLCGFPAQPKATILRKFGKFDKLPNLPKILAGIGYTSNYYYSGNLEFANTKAFLNFSGFARTLDNTNYTWHKTTDWGAYDEELFDCHLKESVSDSQPFFSIIMTSTNHEPFDANVEKMFAGNSLADAYRNTAHYTDECIYNYLQKAASEKWFENTIFIITSDHAHSFPKARAANDPERHHIPLIFYGNVLKPEYRGKKIDVTGSQMDLPVMILSQLNLSYLQFTKSKNLFNKHVNGFAFYTFDNGFGIVTKDQTLVFDHDLQQVVMRKNNLSPSSDSVLLDKGKAYLQLMYEEYLGLNGGKAF